MVAKAIFRLLFFRSLKGTAMNFRGMIFIHCRWLQPTGKLKQKRALA